ncbi:DMP19 family protein [Nocardia lijiangensis]|uniref:DMP19 family protein n=1 Tax=Nocardia lijiangensis TaxID=299618 RepID=UPI0008364870|nr:hypothetical protein [Nocardia lijiangensis]
MDYRFQASARAAVARALADAEDIDRAADIAFWSNPATEDLRDDPVRRRTALPPAFANLMVLASLNDHVDAGGFGRFLARRVDDLPWVPGALRAAGMPRLAAAVVVAGYEALAETHDDADLDRLWDDEYAVLDNPDQIRQPRDNTRKNRADALYDANEPADFQQRVLEYARANLDDFVRPDR